MLTAIKNYSADAADACFITGSAVYTLMTESFGNDLITCSTALRLCTVGFRAESVTKRVRKLLTAYGTGLILGTGRLRAGSVTKRVRKLFIAHGTGLILGAGSFAGGMSGSIGRICNVTS